MNVLSKLFTALFLSVLVSSCGEQVSILPCGTCDTDLGIIEESDFDPFLGCAAVYVRDSYVIQSQQAFDDMILETERIDCSIQAFASVDFDKHTLLGLQADGSGCSREFCPSVIDDDKLNQYRYELKVVECGGCEPLETRMIWVLVPRLPINHEVVFEVVD
ncbi:MAG: hypothetical protein AAF206_12625 [Bacteroidota bacterium]